MNRNLNLVLNNNSPVLEGYANIPISDLDTVVNGYINNVVCEYLDHLPHIQRIPILGSIISKIAFEGSATFKMINATVLSQKILRNEINSEQLSNIISSIQSMWTESIIDSVFNNIQHITIQNHYIDNIYSIISVSKKI